MPRKPDDQIDLARAKLTIDKMVDPSVEVNATLLANQLRISIAAAGTHEELYT